MHAWQIKNDCWPHRSNATVKVRIRISAENADSQVIDCSENQHSVFKCLSYKEGGCTSRKLIVCCAFCKFFLPCKYAILYQWQRLEVLLQWCTNYLSPSHYNSIQDFRVMVTTAHTRTSLDMIQRPIHYSTSLKSILVNLPLLSVKWKFILCTLCVVDRGSCTLNLTTYQKRRFNEQTSCTNMIYMFRSWGCGRWIQSMIPDAYHAVSMLATSGMV